MVTDTEIGVSCIIWCVEDDAGIREIEMYTLRSTGFQAKGFEDGAAFQAALKEQQPELVILDVMLPGKDGVTLLRELKSDPATRDLPVIMATARGAEYDKIQSLDLGADDYLVKPFGMMELVSRVRAVLRRCQSRAKSGVFLEWRGLVLRTDARTVTVDGELVPLTYKEYELLHRFLSRPGVVFTRDQLLSDVWGIDYTGETRTVDVHIRTLRQKLGPYGACVETVRQVGYRWEEKL